MTNDSHLHDCAGALIAGGRGTRLGGLAKATLVSGGESLAARTTSLLGSLFDDVVVVANEPDPWTALGLRVERDRIPGKGAPGGLHTALAATSETWVFTAACDMPFLSERAIRHLAGRRAATTANAIVPLWNGRSQPLHALWRRAAVLPLLERLLESGDPSLQQLVAIVGAELVPPSEWERVDPGGRSLENANTPEDLARLGLLPPSPRG